MKIIAKVGEALQNLLGEIAEETGKKAEIIVRRRKFNAMSLARTFILGYLHNPAASDEDLAQMAMQCGADVTPQAIEQRYSPKLVGFLRELFGKAVRIVVGSDKALAPILERFTTVTVLDSTTIALPDDQQEEYPGCGGSYGGGAAAVKLQTELDLRCGAITHVEIEPGRIADSATSRQGVRRDPGSLRITDLGYFSLTVFAAMTQASEYFLSRLQFPTGVFSPAGVRHDLLNWLAEQASPFVDHEVQLGQKHRFSCRLIAWRLPEEQANRRRQKLCYLNFKKYGKMPQTERLAWCDWTILVTNVPITMMTPKEAVVLYRARWQIELLFKRWKSQDRVAILKGSSTVRQMVGLWARLLAALVRHWLSVGSVWGDPQKSLYKVCKAISHFAGRVAASLDFQQELQRVLADLRAVVTKTCQRNKRSKPGTFELLNDLSLLDFRLT
jgi:hypothetical protein